MMPRASLIDGEKTLYRDPSACSVTSTFTSGTSSGSGPKCTSSTTFRRSPIPLLWWFEGGTSWLGDLICLRSGAWTEDNWKEFNLKVNRHLNRHGAAHESGRIQRIGMDHLYKRPRGPVSGGSFYLEGEFAMMALDVELRRRTRGAAALTT